MKRAWLAWLVFGLCAGAMLVIMAWGTRKLIQLDVREKSARQEAGIEENVRLSLWRMETALASIVVQENSRPYTAYFLSERGTPSSPYVKLHFQIDPNGRLVLPSIAESHRTDLFSPQGAGALRDPAAQSALSAAIPRTWIIVEQSARSRGAKPVISAQEENASPKPAPSGNASSAGSQPEASQAISQMVQQAEPVLPGIDTQQRPQSQMARNFQEFEVRGLLNSQNALPQTKPPAPSNRPIADRKSVEIRTGVLAPVWVGDDLILARHVQVGSREMLQGCMIDWLKVRSALLANIADLLPGSDLIPERGRFDPAEGRTLTSLPLRLVPGRMAGAAAEERSPILFSLKIAWACMAVAILAVGFLLMGALSLSQRRAAFVSSVTHELRSPLTTFRMYTEMLVEGMATDAAKQSQYHQTLYRESDRLVHLVENVLSYARLERGRYGAREAVSMGDLIDRTRDRLLSHSRLAGMQLLIAIEAQAGAKIVRVDASAVERILFNLVDNACKYARPAADRRIHLEVSREASWGSITVRDHGPGIDRQRAKQLFEPFRKSAREAAGTAPGIGIGLPLSRRLARAVGGRLVVVDCQEGACLRLDLPSSPDTR